jgi:hypothetical protein
VYAIPTDGQFRFRSRGGSAFAVTSQGWAAVLRLGKSLVGLLGVSDLVEGIDLPLQLLEARCEDFFVEPLEQRLVDAFVLALRRRFIGFSDDWFNAEAGDVGDRLPDRASLSVRRRCGTPCTATLLRATPMAFHPRSHELRPRSPTYLSNQLDAAPRIFVRRISTNPAPIRPSSGSFAASIEGISSSRTTLRASLSS